MGREVGNSGRAAREVRGGRTGTGARGALRFLPLLRRRTVRPAHAHGWFGIGLAGLRSAFQALSLQLLYASRDRRGAGAAPKGLKADEVASAQLAVATPMLHTIGEPLDRKQAPQTAYEAKFSGPYTVASALIGGSGLGLGIDDFTDTLVAD